MPERRKPKPRTTRAPQAARSSGTTAAGRPEAGRVAAARGDAAALERVTAERDRLLAELEVARRRITELEGLAAQTLDRIDWALDSLHSLNE
jgi:hypothetical protein